MAFLVGTYDASTFIENDYATYPQLPPGVTLYQPGMFWLVEVEGYVYSQHVLPGDLLFVLPNPRPYGTFTFGDKRYGGSDRNGEWTVDEIWFLAWDAHLAPPDQVPYPNSGCPFTSDEQPLGNWAPGWRIVVDAHFNDDTLQRRYGTSFYGNDVFGTVESPLGGARWVDITEPSFSIETGDGMQNGGPRVTVSEVDIQFLDPVGTWFDIATPATWFQPQPGTPIRVGLIDPAYRYHPIITAEIERIEDVHDGEHPRIVAVRGFGRIMDLVVDVPQVPFPAEQASARFNRLVDLAGWYWDDGTVTFPTGDAPLLAEAEPRDTTIREELDVTCQSVGWFLDSDKRGRMRVREWPHLASGEPIPVTDCFHPEINPNVPQAVLDKRVSHSIVFANDESQLLNYVVSTNKAEVPASIVEVEDVSVARFGKRGRAYSFPLTGAPWADPVATQVWAERVKNRFAFITRQVESFEVDTLLDEGWLKVLADLETGRGVRVERTGLRPLRMDGIVVGWRHTLTPGRWQSSVYLSTLTPSY